MKKLLIALTLLATISANASCLGIYQNLVVSHNEKASKSVIALMGDTYMGMADFIYNSENADLYSQLMAPLAAVVISPIVLYAELKYKSNYRFYERLMNSLSNSENERDVSKLKRAIARRYSINTSEFIDVLEDLNDAGLICEGDRVNTVLSKEGMDFIRSRGYSSYLQVGLSARQDPYTFQELNSNPLYRETIVGNALKVSKIKKIIREEIKARGHTVVRK